MILRDVEPGKRILFPYCGKTGVVISHGNMGTRWIADSATRQVTIEASTTGEKVEFEAPGRAQVVSSGSEVEVVSAA